MAEREWTAKSRGNRLGYEIFQFFLKHFGVRFAYANLTYVVPHFMLFARNATSALWFYYRTIFKKNWLQTIGCIYKHFFKFGQCIVDKVAIQCGLQDKFKYEFGENYDEFLCTLNGAQGVIVIGAHVGAWQMGCSFFGDCSKRLNIVMVDAEREMVKQFTESDDKNYNIIAVNKTDGLEMALNIKRALNAGEAVCIQGDRYTNEERVMTAKFMGRDANFPEGPFLLGAKLRVPVLFYFATHQKGGYHFSFEKINPQAEKMTKETLLERYVASLEKVLKAHPQQWFNFYDFWGK